MIYKCKYIGISLYIDSNYIIMNIDKSVGKDSSLGATEA